MILTLINLPLVAALLAWYADERWRARLLPLTAGLHVALVGLALTQSFRLKPDAWFRLDPLGGWILLAVSVMFLILACYAPAYLRLRPERDHRLFTVCLLAFLGMASLTATSRHPGVLWVGMEALTLVTTPLIYFNHNPRSLEATWKYLLVCSVGMALALLGTFFVAYAANLGGLGDPLYFDRMVTHAKAMPILWLKAGFVLTLVGYGTKMGLAPLHTWKPDAYGETPGIVGSLLAGGVTSCAFLALVRIYSVVVAAGEGAFARELLLALGLLSMAWALGFMVRQGDLRRLLAYSSVEHMGILAFGLGVGGARFALYHAAANALVKSALFLASGNIIRSYASRELSHLTGALRRVPVSGWLFFLGFAAVTCSPPFAPFVSAFGISSSAFHHGHPWAGGAFLILLGGIFIASGAMVLPMLQGVPPRDRIRTPHKDTPGTVLPIAAALGLALLLGLWLPGPMNALLSRATALVEVEP